jgi:hypothetical protein
MHHDGLVSRVEAKHVDLLLGDPRGVGRGGSYAALVDREIVADDVGRGVTSRQCVEHHAHENASAANSRLPVTQALVDRDLLEQFLRYHGNSVPAVRIDGDGGDRC